MSNSDLFQATFFFTAAVEDEEQGKAIYISTCSQAVAHGTQQEHPKIAHRMGKDINI